MQMWSVTLPGLAVLFLNELKKLALLEFIPFYYFWEQSKPSMEAEEVGIDRFGSNSLVDGFGVMLIIAIVIASLLVLLVFFRWLSTYYKCVAWLYQLIKKKIQYNAVLRYVLQSTLKLQITACTVIVYDQLTTKET